MPSRQYSTAELGRLKKDELLALFVERQQALREFEEDHERLVLRNIIACITLKANIGLLNPEDNLNEAQRPIKYVYESCRDAAKKKSWLDSNFKGAIRRMMHFSLGLATLARQLNLTRIYRVLAAPAQ